MSMFIRSRLRAAWRCFCTVTDHAVASWCVTKMGTLLIFGGRCSVTPEKVAYYADYPSYHQDLTARHKWLIRWARDNSHKLSEDPEWIDAKAAGWWAWGISNWIGGGWCKDDGVEHSQIPFTGGVIGGRGTSVNAYNQRPYIDNNQGGMGVQVQTRDSRPVITQSISSQGVAVHTQDKRPVVKSHLSSQGVAVHAYDKRPFIRGEQSDARGVNVHDSEFNDIGTGRRLLDKFFALQQRLAKVFVLDRDWSSAVTPTVLGLASKNRNYQVAVFLDPPYILDDRADLYVSDIEKSNNVAIESYQWAVENGDRVKIAYAMFDGDFPVPDGWASSVQNFMGRNEKGGRQDCVIFSPACKSQEQQQLF